MSLPEINLSTTYDASHIAHHGILHDWANRLMDDAAVGDAAVKDSAGSAMATVLQRQPVAVGASNVGIRTHTVAGIVTHTITRDIEALKINASANITGLDLTNLHLLGAKWCELPVLLTNTSGSAITVNLGGVQVTNPPPATLAAGAKWPFVVTRMPSPIVGRLVDVYFTDFPTAGAAATVLGSEWVVYDFATGNAGWGARRASAATVVAEATASGNVLRFTATNGTGADAGQLVHAGVALMLPQVFCQVEVRVRCTDDPDQVTSMVCIMWPAADQARFPDADGGVFPAGGELDMWETFANRATRTPAESHIHRLNPLALPPYTHPPDDEALHFSHPGIDGSSWHKVVFDWYSAAIYATVDNGSPLLMTTDPAWIPSWPMVLTMQLDAWDSPSAPGVQPVLSGGNTPTMDIDYVAIRQYT